MGSQCYAPGKKMYSEFYTSKTEYILFSKHSAIVNNKNVNISNSSTLTEKTKHPEESIQQHRTLSVSVTIVFSNFTKM